MTCHVATHKSLKVSLNFLQNELSNVSNVSNGENSPQNSPQKQHFIEENKKRSCETPYLNGWGGWIRTSGTRYQKPLPYHLATPHPYHFLLAFIFLCKWKVCKRWTKRWKILSFRFQHNNQNTHPHDISLGHPKNHSLLLKNVTAHTFVLE